MTPRGPKQSLLGPFTFSAGYVDTFKGSGFRRDFDLGTAGPIPSQEFKMQPNGAWLGAAQNFYIGKSCGMGKNCGFVASGGILIPSEVRGNMVEQGPVIVPARSEFTAKTQWGRLDTAGFCEVFRTPTCDYGVMVLGGFRWDYFSPQVDGTSRDGTGALLNTFTGDLTVNSYIPYLGLQCTRSFCNSSANVRFIANPGLFWGDIKLKDTEVNVQVGPGAGLTDAPVDWGSLLELYAVYSVCLSKNLQAGAYFDWTHLQLKSRQRNNVFTNAVGTTITPETVHLDRNSWSIGGTVLINFDFDPCS
jgi:hypothetical protein